MAPQEFILYAATVVTEPRGYFQQLVASATRNHTNLKVLGMGQPWQGYLGKLSMYLQYFQSLPEGAVCMAIDGFDTIILAPGKEIMKKFIASGHRIIISAEAEPTMLLQKLCYSLLFTEVVQPSADSSSCYKFLNSGMCIGYKEDLVDLFWEVINQQGPHTDDDQVALIRHLRNNPGAFHVDSARYLFLNSRPLGKFFELSCGKVDLAGEGVHLVLKHGTYPRLQVQENGNMPCVFQSPGKGDINDVLVSLGYQPSQSTSTDFIYFKLHKMKVTLAEVTLKVLSYFGHIGMTMVLLALIVVIDTLFD